MGVQLSATGVLALAALGLGVYVYTKRGAIVESVVNTVTTAVNPTDSNNVANRAFEVIQKQATGEDSFSDWLLKKFNPTAYEALQNKPTPIAPRASYDETERLLKRYPTSTAPDTIYSGGWLNSGYSFSDLSGFPTF